MNTYNVSHNMDMVADWFLNDEGLYNMAKKARSFKHFMEDAQHLTIEDCCMSKRALKYAYDCVNNLLENK